MNIKSPKPRPAKIIKIGILNRKTFLLDYLKKNEYGFYYEALKKQTKNGKWNNLRFVSPNEKSDLDLLFTIHRKPFSFNKTIFLDYEPSRVKKDYTYFWRFPKERFFFYNYSIKKHGWPILWLLNKDYNYLIKNSPKKTKILSSVLPSYIHYPAQKQRVYFISNYLDKLNYFDHYGKIYDPNAIWFSKGAHEKTKQMFLKMKHYRGFLDNKEDGLLPYKYTFTCETAREKNYFTEKLVDAILCECLCFYDGCSNVEKFIDPRCFIRVDIRKPQEAIRIIEESIKNGEWEKRIKSIRAQKVKILNEMQIFPMIEKILKGKGILL
ncbi:hypothetical protein KA107_00255 [Candidatus Pacearchaeota archaeon]|nr:hypothetical protein [Candidatus Pacearchaeota archaeon]